MGREEGLVAIVHVDARVALDPVLDYVLTEQGRQELEARREWQERCLESEFSE